MSESRACSTAPRWAFPYESWADGYDALLGSRTFPAVRDAFEWVVRRHRIPFRSVADVGCGTGSFVRYLRRLGARVFGVDRSAAMVARARTKNRRNGAIFLRQDLRDLRLPHRVDLITCNFDVLNYLLDRSELEQAFRTFRRNLVVPGHLVFDLMVTGPGGLAPSRQRLLVRTPRMRSLWIISIEPHRRLRRVLMLHWPLGKRRDVGPAVPRHRANGPIRELHVQRAHATAEVRAALRQARFVVLGVHRLQQRARHRREVPTRLMFVARSI